MGEEVYLNPRIVIFHDFLTDSEIETIKSMATPRFKRATVQNYLTGELETANYRVSKTAWLKEWEHDHVGHVYTRTHQLTGLNMETSEELQVSNYGIGGHYEPHFDFARREEKNAFASLGTGKKLVLQFGYLLKRCRHNETCGGGKRKVSRTKLVQEQNGGYCYGRYYKIE